MSSFLALQAGESASGFDEPLRKINQQLALAEYGIVIKPYPSCAYTHRAIDGLRDLQTEHGFSADTVTHITACIPFHNASILTYTHPIDDSEARFCMKYCLAVALLNGTVLPADFEERAITAPEIQPWLDRVTLEAHPHNAESSDLSVQEPAIVTVRLHDDTIFEQRVDFARGMPQRPFTKADLETKFMGLVAKKLGVSQSEQLLQQLWHFEQIEDVSSFLGGLIDA